MNKFKLETFFKNKSNFNNILLLEGLLVGLIAGLVACLYRFLLSNAESIAYKLSALLHKGVSSFFIVALILVVLGLVISKFLSYEPFISGSGIPQVEAEMIDCIDENPIKVIVSKMIAGTLCIIGGLSLGREGPSIQLGAMVGKGFSKLFKRIKVEEKFLLTCGAAAGLSAAFNAPLAGVLFALEEVHKNFSPLALVSVMVASLTGDFISKNIFGMTPSLYFPLANQLPLNQYGYLILLGIITGILGVFYNTITVSTLKLYDKITFLKKPYKIFIPLLISLFVMYFFPELLCGGHHIIEMIREGNLVFSIVVLLLIGKFTFSLISFGSGAPGGIFFPLLVLGSLVGCGYGLLVTNYCGVDPIYLNHYIVVAMAGLFAGIVRAPITGIVLIAEMCGSLTQFLPISIVCFVGYVVANVLRCEPIYHSLLHRLIKGNHTDTTLDDKVILHYSLELGAECLEKQIKELALPKECFIISITRGIDEIVPRGDTVLHLGDFVTVLIEQNHLDNCKDILDQMFCHHID